MFENDFRRRWLDEAGHWITADLLVPETGYQVLVVVLAFGIAWAAARPVKRPVERAVLGALIWLPEAGRDRALSVVSGLVLPSLWLGLLLLSRFILSAADLPTRLVVVAAYLNAAWVVIRLASAVIREPAWARLFALFAWSIAALNILGVFADLLAALDAFAVTLGGLRLSALTVAKSISILIVLLWAGRFLARLLAGRLARLPSLTPSIQVLTANLLNFLFITVAVVAALSTLGIDLTAFAVFSGAVGVGVGFGLQKIVSNLVSGIIILLDRSVKPGDVIAIGQTYGWINSLNARYVSVITRDGTEHLIPNEELITQRVENWSHSDNLVRLRAPVGVSYKTDPRKAIALCIEAAKEVPRVLAEPKPVCLVTGFGDSSVDLELRFWINDPPNGIGNVVSQVYLLVWDKFHAHGIEIPFPQRDLHFKSSDLDKPPTVTQAGAAPTDAAPS